MVRSTMAFAVAAVALAGVAVAAGPATLDGPATVVSPAVRAHPSTMIQIPGGPPPVVPGDPVPNDHACPATARAAVADKAAQRFWLCVDGHPVTGARPMTTGAWSYGLPPVGTYRVFAKLRWNTGIHGELLERFVAFYRTPRNNRIAFHEVVHQDPATVGDLAKRGSSSGCFRLLESDSILVWDFLQPGDPVVITTP
jgi:lipoprotein-anchoring transpeptidase ErfK/SrfK